MIGLSFASMAPTSSLCDLPATSIDPTIGRRILPDWSTVRRNCSALSTWNRSLIWTSMPSPEAKMYSEFPGIRSAATGAPISVAKASCSTSITSILRRIGMEVGVCSK